MEHSVQPIKNIKTLLRSGAASFDYGLCGFEWLHRESKPNKGNSNKYLSTQLIMVDALCWSRVCAVY